MKVAHIVPTALLSLTKFNDYHLILPHLMEEGSDYATFYKEEATGHKILDNGIAEAVDFDWKALLRLAATLQADEVVAPDVMGDRVRTVETVRQFRPLALAHPEFKYIGVIQGKSYSDLAAMLAFYEQQEWISVIALPRVLCHSVHKDIRFNFLDAFEKQIKERFEAVHCLGAASVNPKEVILLSDTMARGIDTSFPSVMGLDKRMIDIDPGVTRGQGFFEAKPNPKQLMCIEHNLQQYVEWAR